MNPDSSLRNLRRRAFVIAGSVAAMALSTLLVACGGGDDAPAPVAKPLSNQLYTQTNETANAVVHFTRQADGTLVRAETTPTTGAGTNAVNASGATVPDSLVSQHSLIISPDAKTLFVVNGGDDSISSFSINQKTGALTLLKKSAATAGHRPNSLALYNGVLYATFIGGANALAAYQVGSDGGLTQIAAYNLNALGGVADASPTQVVVSPDGASVVVSAGTKAGAIISFPIQTGGSLGTPVVTAGVATPFAGVYLPQKTNPVYLSTGITGVSLTAYSDVAGTLTQISQATASATAGVAAPCWLVLNPAGTVAFVGNGSGSITTYAIGASGLVSLLNATAAVETGIKTGVPSVAGDSWVSADGKFLYTAFLGNDKVVAYSIGLNGSLAKIGETRIGTSTGLSLQGLAGI